MSTIPIARTAPACLLVLVALAAPAPAGTRTESRKYVADLPQPDQLFGYAVAIQGETTLIGARQDGDLGAEAGAAFLFDTVSGGQLLKLHAADGAAGDQCGSSVGLDGTTAVVGAPGDDTLLDSGAAYLFDTATGMQTAKLLAPDGAAGDAFGEAVAISGSRILVGARYHAELAWAAGAAYLFDRETGETTELLASDGGFGERFGTAVAIRGTLAIVGAPGDAPGGSAYLFDASTGAELHKLVPSDGAFGDDFGLAVAVDGALAVVGAPGHGGHGAAYVFDTATGVELGKLVGLGVGQGDEFGLAVALSGQHAVVGARWDVIAGVATGAAQLFEWGSAAPPTKLLASDGHEGDGIGFSVAIDGDAVAVGALLDDGGAPDAGAAYVYTCQPVSYCTPGTSASGCQATLAAAGAPSATAVSGFTLSAGGVEGGKDGLFFFAANGRQGAPWGNGSSLQCVVPPVLRGGLLVGAGTPGSCDGALAQDLNARWCPGCPKPAANPGAGAIVQAQLWYRDPLNTSNQTTSFSDAIEFCVEP